MQSGTFNFWIDRDLAPNAFGLGARFRWGSFQIGGETCIVCSDGPTLTATLRMGAPDRVHLFRIPFEVDGQRRHLVTIGWSHGRMKVCLDSKVVAEMDMNI